MRRIRYCCAMSLDGKGHLAARGRVALSQPCRGGIRRYGGSRGHPHDTRRRHSAGCPTDLANRADAEGTPGLREDGHRQPGVLGGPFRRAVDTRPATPGSASRPRSSTARTPPPVVAPGHVKQHGIDPMDVRSQHGLPPVSEPGFPAAAARQPPSGGAREAREAREARDAPRGHNWESRTDASAPVTAQAVAAERFIADARMWTRTGGCTWNEQGDSTVSTVCTLAVGHAAARPAWPAGRPWRAPASPRW